MSLSKDTFFYSIANWGRRLVGFIAAPVIIAYLSPSDYGYMSLVMTIASFCSILGLLAVSDQGLPRFFIDTKEEIEKKRYVTTSFFISGIGVLSVVLIIICSTPVVPIVIKDIKAAFIFTLLVAFLCLSQSLLYVGNNMLKWTFRSSLFTKITIIQTLIGA
ncbi:MAG: oligosaccharide flippase family protein, partial [Desulfobacterales bacterium]|nr:oligosaccharide flippase family protein [Desulfobacterales bacterium]